MTTPIGAARARLTRAGHLPAVLVDGSRMLAPLLGGRAARLTVGPPVDDVLAAVLDHGPPPAAAAVGDGRSVMTPLAPPGRLGSPAGHGAGMPSGSSSAAGGAAGGSAGGSGAGSEAGSGASLTPGSMSSTGPARAAGAGSRSRSAGSPAGRAGAPVAAASGAPTSPSDRRTAALATTPDAGEGAAAGHDRPLRAGEPAPVSAPVALGSSPAARSGSRLVVAPDGAGRQGPGTPGPRSGDGGSDGGWRSAANGRRLRPPGDGEHRPSSAPERDAGAFDAGSAQPAAPSADRGSGGTSRVPRGTAATGPRLGGATPPPAVASEVGAPKGLAALATWWEKHDGVERGEIAVASRLLDTSPPARRATSPAVAGETGDVDDGALLALDRFTAALEQVLISEAASHGIEVQR